MSDPMTMAPDQPWIPTLLAVLTLLACLPTACRPSPPLVHHQPLPQQAYVWQRDISPTLLTEIHQHSPALDGLILLATELDFQSSSPRQIHIPWDAPRLSALGQPVGLAVRIAPYQGSFLPTAPATRVLLQEISHLLATTQSHGTSITELQLDFDAADSQLAGYQQWIHTLRTVTGTVPLVITALPSWLNQPTFQNLVRATDGFVLQVHSLARPTHRDAPFTLCDPGAARKAVLRAARARVPFRVALPTYAYLAAFNAQGQFLGASAEGPPPQRPPDTTYRELAADPNSLAQLIQEWSHTRPTTLTGVIWYRFPLSSDRWNWRWPTLASVMSGQPPQSRVLTHLDASPTGLIELRLTQDGSADHTGPLTAHLHWSHAPLLAHDAIRGFQATPTPDGLTFHHHTLRLRPGDSIVAGWLRLGSNVPVQVELAIPSSSNSYSAQRAAIVLENHPGAPHATSPRPSMSSDTTPVQSSPP